MKKNANKLNCFDIPAISKEAVSFGFTAKTAPRLYTILTNAVQYSKENPSFTLSFDFSNNRILVSINDNTKILTKPNIDSMIKTKKESRWTMQQLNKPWDGRVRSFTEVTIYDAFMESVILDKQEALEKMSHTEAPIHRNNFKEEE